MNRQRMVRQGCAAALAALLVGSCSSPVPEALAPPPLPPVAPAPSAPTTAPSPQPRPTQNPTDDPPQAQTGRAAREEITSEIAGELSVELTSALESGEVEEWLALMDMSEESRDQQSDWFSAVQEVPMDVRAIHFTGVHQDFDETSGTVVFDAQFVHQVTGADRVPALQNYRFTLSRDADGDPRVVEVLAEGGWLDVSPQLWDLGAVDVLVGESVVLLSPARRSEDAQYLLEAIDIASQEVLDAMGSAGVDRLFVTMADTDQLPVLFGGAVGEEGDWAGFAASVPGLDRLQPRGDGLTRTVRSSQDSPVRGVLEWDYSLQEWDYHGWGTYGGLPLMRHEGVHMAQALIHPDSWPAAWVVEGFAGWFEVTGDEWVREDHLSWYENTTDGVAPDGLPTAARLDFYGEDAQRNYAEAAMVFLFVEEEWGAHATFELGSALHGVGPRSEEIGDILLEYLGVGYEPFEDGFVAWARDYVS